MEENPSRNDHWALFGSGVQKIPNFAELPGEIIQDHFEDGMAWR